MIGIYKIESPSGAVYIGQSWYIENRIKCYGNNPNKKQRKLYASIKKHGFKNHVVSICHELPSDINQDILNQYEDFYLTHYRYLGFPIMNVRDAGSNGKLSEETKQIISKKLKEHAKHNPERYRLMSIAAANVVRGSKLSEQHCKRISEGQIGKVLSPSHIEQIRARSKKFVVDNPEWYKEFKRKGVEACIGVKRPQHVLDAISKAHKGKKLSQHQIESFRKRNTGLKRTKEQVYKKIQDCTFNRPVSQYSKSGEFIKDWRGAPEVERTLGIKRTSISACINLKRASAGGFAWVAK